MYIDFVMLGLNLHRLRFSRSSSRIALTDSRSFRVLKHGIHGQKPGKDEVDEAGSRLTKLEKKNYQNSWKVLCDQNKKQEEERMSRFERRRENPIRALSELYNLNHQKNLLGTLAQDARAEIKPKKESIKSKIRRLTKDRDFIRGRYFGQRKVARLMGLRREVIKKYEREFEVRRKANQTERTELHVKLIALLEDLKKYNDAYNAASDRWYECYVDYQNITYYIPFLQDFGDDDIVEMDVLALDLDDTKNGLWRLVDIFFQKMDRHGFSDLLGRRFLKYQDVMGVKVKNADEFVQLWYGPRISLCKSYGIYLRAFTRFMNSYPCLQKFHAFNLRPGGFTYTMRRFISAFFRKQHLTLHGLRAIITDKLLNMHEVNSINSRTAEERGGDARAAMQRDLRAKLRTSKKSTEYLRHVSDSQLFQLITYLKFITLFAATFILLVCIFNWYT